MKDKVLKVISDNSVPKHFCEYGEGIFADINAVDSMVEDIVKLFSIPNVSQQRELLLAYHKHLDGFNDPTIYNASEEMIDDYLANNCG